MTRRTSQTQKAIALVEQLPPDKLQVALNFLEQLALKPPLDETQLLQKIHHSIDPSLQHRLITLLQQRDAEQLTPDAHQELIQLAQHIEALNVERITHLAALAKLRQTTLSKVIEELGLKPIEYA